jgi:excisionase family DNA binding protein
MSAELDAKMAAKKMADDFFRLMEILINETTKTLAVIELKAEGRMNENPLSPGWVSKKRAAEHLGIGDRTLTDWMARRLIPYVRVGRKVIFNLREIDEHLKRREVQAKF